MDKPAHPRHNLPPVSPQNSPLRIVVVGAGQHARRSVLPALAASPECELHGICTRNPEVREELSVRYECVPYRSIEDVVADAAVDAVYVATPPATHATIARTALTADKHVLVEKPLVTDPGTARELITIAANRTLVLMEGYMFMHHPQMQLMHSLIQRGEIGRLFSITARFGFPHLPPDNFRYSHAAGGGALLDAAGYPLRAAWAFLGSTARVVAARFTTESTYEVDLGGTALLENAQRQVALIEWGFGRCYRAELEAWGETGILGATRIFAKPPDLATSLSIRDSSQHVKTLDVAAANHFECMVASFVRASNEPAERQSAYEAAELQSRLLGDIQASAGDSRATAGISQPSHA